MFRVIEDTGRIAKSERKLLRRINNAGGAPKREYVGFPGGPPIRAEVYSGKGLGFWLAYKQLNNRFWNGLGVGDFFEERKAPTAEVNPPLNGIHRRCMGAFLQDESGRTWLAHRGALGGGRKGIGSNFFSWYPKELVRSAQDGDRQTEMILIGRLDAPGFVRALRGFVLLADAFRAGQSNPSNAVADQIGDDIYFDEFSGSTSYRKTASEVVADFVHGRIVRALKEEIVRLGHRVSKDRHRDLFVARARGQAQLLYEVKTSADSQSLYTALGQLMWHRDNASKVAVVIPGAVSDKARRRLRDLGVSVVTWSGRKTIKFAGLEASLLVGRQSTTG